MGTNFFDFKKQMTPRRRKPAAAKPVAAPVGAASDANALTVTQLTSQVERALRTGFPAPVLVKGEVSNYRPHAPSGHVYFTLKDAGSCLSCVMWKSEAIRLKFEPADGMELLARGDVQIYRQQGKYQLCVTRLEPLGKGALEIAFRQLQAKLQAEGLFDAERKRPMPRYPTRIVLVTSHQTAAFHDMLKVLRRFPWLRLFVYHVPVQGEGAGRRIAESLAHLSRCLKRTPTEIPADAIENPPARLLQQAGAGQVSTPTHLTSIGGGDRFNGADVVLLSRGGGSLEDLWAFNDEALARAIAACPVPVVTGIGHEIDTSIADLVADYHAHTPTEAAQVVTANWRGAREIVGVSVVRLARAVRSIVQHGRQRLLGCERHEMFRRPLYRVLALRQLIDDRQRALAMVTGDRLTFLRRRVDVLAASLARTPPAVILLRQRGRLNALDQALQTAADRRLRRSRSHVASLQARLGERHPRNAIALATQRVEGLVRQLAALAPERVLQRGYSITRRKRDGAILRTAQDVRPGERIVTHVADGEIESVVEDGRQPRLFD